MALVIIKGATINCCTSGKIIYIISPLEVLSEKINKAYQIFPKRRLWEPFVIIYCAPSMRMNYRMQVPNPEEQK